MVCFAANSVLARLALSNGDIGPLAYTGLRLACGALVLGAIVYMPARNPISKKSPIAGTWSGAFTLLLYAVTFSVAYIMIGAGPGTLILFASVQIGMLVWALLKGDRPGPLEWIGIASAFGALVYLVSPGLVAPSPMGASLMAIAGVSWGAYSLIGRGSQAPLADTAGNFIRCLLPGVALIALGSILSAPNVTGIVYASISGALTSGLGYIIWYSVLPLLSGTRAAFVQLTVPAIAASGGVVLLGEPVTARFLLATAGILGGVSLTLLGSARRASPATDAKDKQ
jgi:drug/metabolite transporter (DMT)-like permease